jgi:Xaa-Pro aminopeptidase
MNQLASFRNEMAAQGIKAMLLSNPDSISWLTGFTGSFGRVLVTPERAVLITDSRYTLQAGEQADGFEVKTFASPVNGDEFLATQISEIGVDQIGFEGGYVTHATWEKWSGALGAKLQSAPDIISQLRMKKTPDEIEKVRRACGISDAAFDHICRIIRPGISEIDVAIELEFFMRKQEATSAFDIIAVSGERSARPHGTPSEKRLEEGDFLTMDFGARVEGYNSDMTRTVVVGTASPRHKEVYETVLEAQLEALHAIRPGAQARDVDRLARDVLATRNLDQYFGHGLGHGLGRLVHDSGRMAATSEDTFAPGQIWTVEPGVYIPGFGGVRIEDDVLVTDDGIEILTHSTKELLELPA